ncbi:MAG: NAD-dependent epimerase/dehydratase family protein [Promethearchaeota archaeon]
MKILLTGPFGNVGLSTLEELINRNYDIKVFDVKNKKNKKVAKRFENQIEIIWGDLRNYEDIEKVVKGVNVIIHLAAIIPPLADKLPELAEEVNVGGTKNIIKAIKAQNNKPKLIFTSSIAVYGDRRKNPLIKLTDPLNPSKGDYYAVTKIKAENIIRESGIDFAIFRLTYITSVNKLDMDPLMFHMPLDTCIEICDTKDVGLALVNGIESNEVWGDTFHIAGGEKCRTTYREYINDMMEIFGLGKDFLPEQAYEQKDFHCGFMDTEKSQNLLKYQRHSLDDYYEEVRKKVGPKKFFIPLVKWAVRLNLLKRSEAYRRNKFFRKKIGAFTVSENKLIRKILYNNFNKIDMLEQKVYELEKVIRFLIEKDEYLDLLEQKEQI